MFGIDFLLWYLQVLDAGWQKRMLLELSGSALKCIMDQNGNHVIQKIIEHVRPWKCMAFIMQVGSACWSWNLNSTNELMRVTVIKFSIQFCVCLMSLWESAICPGRLCCKNLSEFVKLVYRKLEVLSSSIRNPDTMRFVQPIYNNMVRISSDIYGNHVIKCLLKNAPPLER